MKNLKYFVKNNTYLILFILLIIAFFYPFFLFGKMPIPSDTIVGMYHPWRDVVWDGFVSGVPFKNFLITDPVRQQYIWRTLAIDQLKTGKFPLWNPYSFSGTPLHANFQTAVFYPLNLLFFILPFNLAWGMLIFLQPFLGGIFLYFYLRHIKLSKIGSFIGSTVYSFSGFSIAWMEWNTIGHVAAWLPLSLFAIEKITSHIQRISKISIRQAQYRHIKDKKLNIWSLILIFSSVSSFLAGHLQIFFYSFVVTTLYIAVKVVFLKHNKLKTILLFTIYYLIFTIITSIQWLPTLKFINQSARAFDQTSFLEEGWFIPWQHLIQFIAPDFFGNPATGNYWGVWNYGEMVGFIGVVPLIFALYAIIFRQDKKTLFFGSLVFLALILSTPTFLAKLPFILRIPFISTSQPTRLLYIVDFALSVLAALGFDKALKDNSLKRNIYIFCSAAFVLLIIWLNVLFPQMFGLDDLYDNLRISLRNLILPTCIFILSCVLIIALLRSKKRIIRSLVVNLLLLTIIFDLFRFGAKFTPFVKSSFIFPTTSIINLIKKDNGYFRIMALDRRIMPPNFAAFYKLQDVAGYDPLYLNLYGKMVSAWERNKPDISPASFNRIITPSNYQSFFADLLGIKYILSFGPLKSEKLKFLSNQGETYLYENKHVFPRAFLTKSVIKVKNAQDEIEKMFVLNDNLRTMAVISENINLKDMELSKEESVEIINYTDNYIRLETRTTIDRMLVLSDIYYHTWSVKVDGEKVSLHKVNSALRGVVVPKGTHMVEFHNNLL